MVEELRQSARRASAAAERVADAAVPAVQLAGAGVVKAAGQVGSAASELETLARAGQPLVADLRRSADQISAAAAALAAAAAQDSSLRRNADTALQEMAAAARAMRALAELLERYPQSILRGRPASP
jgi:paraquat-inducible protein B